MVVPRALPESQLRYTGERSSAAKYSGVTCPLARNTATPLVITIGMDRPATFERRSLMHDAEADMSSRSKPATRTGKKATFPTVPDVVTTISRGRRISLSSSLAIPSPVRNRTGFRTSAIHASFVTSPAESLASTVSLTSPARIRPATASGASRRTVVSCVGYDRPARTSATRSSRSIFSEGSAATSRSISASSASLPDFRATSSWSRRASFWTGTSHVSTRNGERIRRYTGASSAQVGHTSKQIGRTRSSAVDAHPSSDSEVIPAPCPKPVPSSNPTPVPTLSPYLPPSPKPAPDPYPLPRPLPSSNRHLLRTLLRIRFRRHILRSVQSRYQNPLQPRARRPSPQRLEIHHCPESHPHRYRNPVHRCHVHRE